MTGIDDVLERLLTDPAFRRQLATDPEAALAGYELSDDDLRLLAGRLDEDAGDGRSVERRTSKSALAGLLGALGSAGEPAGGGGQHNESEYDFVARRATSSAEVGDLDAGSDAEPMGLPTGKVMHKPANITAPIEPASGGGGVDIASVDGEPVSPAQANKVDVVTVPAIIPSDADTAGTKTQHPDFAWLPTGSHSESEPGDEVLAPVEPDGLTDEPSAPEPAKEKFKPAKPHINSPSDQG